MDAGWSKSRISRLGKALISASPPPAESLSELHELLMVYDAALDVAVARIREHTHVQTTSRLKNTGTILEKLRRSGGGSLGNVQDLAGIRIVLDCDLTEQIRFARRIEKLFSDEARPPKIADKRLEGIRGYRAVHVIATVEGRPVEIQIRTKLQHQWANLFEKFADVAGRGIRYGEPPDEWTVLFDVDRPGSLDTVTGMVDIFEGLSNGIRGGELAETFHSNPEAFTQVNIPDELPSLAELARQKEELMEVLRDAEVMFSRLVGIREVVETGILAGLERELMDDRGTAEGAELDRELLRAAWRKRVLSMKGRSSPPGDDADPADGEGGER